MKKLLAILLFLPLTAMAQDPDIYNPIKTAHISVSEYYSTLWYDYKMYNNLSVNAPAEYTGEPDSVAEVIAGAHDALCWDMEGGLYVTGSIFSTSEFALVHETADSASNPIAPVVQASYGTGWGSELWNLGIVGNNGTIEVAGDLAGGVRGNGTAGSTSQATFVKPVFYQSTFFTKVQMGLAPMALDTFHGGTVWTWGGNNGGGSGGSLSMIGRGNSPTRSFTVPDTVAIPSGIGRPVDIAASGWWGWILTSHHHLLFIGEQAQYGGQGSTVNTPVDVTSSVYSYVKNPATGLADSIVKIAVNGSGTYAICKDSTLWFLWGSTVCGGGGNGNMAIWPLYTANPAPYGGTVIAPWNYDGGFGEIMQTPQQIAPGTHDWICIYTNACYTFGAAFARASGGRQYGLARSKVDPFWLPTIQAAYFDGTISSLLPDSWDWDRLVQIAGPGVGAQPYSTTYQVTSQRCLLSPSSDTCDTYAIPAHTPPTASLTGSSSGGVIYLDGTGTTPGPHATQMYDYLITQTNPSGDPSVLDMGIQTAGANQSSILDTISTAAGAAIPPGVYHFTLRNRNILWDSTLTNLTVTVTSGCGNCIPVPPVGQIHWTLNNQQYEKFFNDLLPPAWSGRPKSEFMSSDVL